MMIGSHRFGSRDIQGLFDHNGHRDFEESASIGLK